MIKHIGILTAGLLSSWNNCIRIPKRLERRAQITEILSAEMDALMRASRSPAPSPEPQVLPIPLTEFGSGLKLTGDYTITETEQSGVVQITVTLTHDLESAASRQYRLVSCRRITEEE